MAHVYILKSLKNGRYYIGSTSSLKRREFEHRIGHSPYTRNLRPLRLVFKQEYSTIKEARKIEHKLKKLKRRDIIEKILVEGFIRMGG